uniref:OSJNBa0056L23.16 protein n=1 Tax=Oryza sativa subsp. japonica TaxID=39947 RepID=Q7XL41_ORYSJ|nr:OSJNBa0056L23.16 [Oryza sativa Japonica Group]
MIFRSFNLLENREKGKRERDDVSPKDDDVSPCDDVGMTSARRPARVDELAGVREVGGGNGDHLHVEDNETNPLVLTTTRNDARRRPATRRKTAAARVDGDERAPVVGGGKEGAAELPCTTAHLLAMTASDGDGGDGAAALLKTAGDGGGLGERRGGARRHGRTRERGQTEEEIKGKLYMSSD